MSYEHLICYLTPREGEKREKKKNIDLIYIINLTIVTLCYKISYLNKINYRYKFNFYNEFTQVVSNYSYFIK